MLLTSCIDKFSNIRVLVIGDIMLDKFEYGKVERISPEAPVTVFKFSHENKMLGGAGNVVANLVTLGCKTTFIGIVGKDDNGTTVANLLRKIGAHSHLLKIDNYPTIVKTRLIAGNNHLLRADQEEVLPVVDELLPKFKKILTQAIKNVDIVLVSDYNKGLLTPITTQIIIDICNHYNKAVLVDPKGTDYSKYKGATLIKPNLKEFSEATKMKYNPLATDFQEKVKIGAELLFSKYCIKNILVTLSEHGMVYIPAKNLDELKQIPTEAKEVFDVSGAGDTSLATLGASIGANIPIKDAMKLANLASGIVVGKLGTATVSAEELKIASFMQAKKLCDVLIVAVNSDASIKRYKGESRPIQDEKTRALLLASLEFIDYVIVFEEDSPLHIVDKLKPDVVAKEGYALDKWPEGRLAISYGGKAITLNRLEGYSTSNLVSKMKG